jgi:hypothetical protein
MVSVLAALRDEVPLGIATARFVSAALEARILRSD